MARVAVVGAGVMGLATARALARAGHHVVVHEQFRLGHDRGSSHGRSRIFRLAYAEGEWVRLAQEALAGWRALEQQAGERLLELDGLLEVVADLSDSSAAGLDAAGVPWERLSAAEAERRFPVKVPEGSFAVFQAEAGIVRADRALAAFAAGLDVREESPVESVDELDADAVVVAAGSWVNDLVDPPLPVRVTRETVCYFRLDERPVPAVVSFRPDTHGHDFYALADPVHGLKVGAHHAGAEADPDVPGEPDPALVGRIAAWTRERFRLADPDPVDAHSCLYTTTPDERFVIERRGRVVVCSACSGHGFKFAPAIGARAAALAAGG
jgi:sarcosine oxidase